MPLIAYQSFNANSSSTHGLAATSLQPFTRAANAHVTQRGDRALVLPLAEGNLSQPVHGPAELTPIARLTGSQTVTVFGAQISLLWQNFNRAFGQMPAILVCGEMDASHPDFVAMVTDKTVDVASVPAQRACQSFTAISQAPLASRISLLHSGVGYVAYSVEAVTVVFVHVPNKIARDEALTRTFYADIARAIHGAGGAIDLVIGDTNQGSADFTARVLNDAVGTKAYKNASAGAGVVKIDNFDVTDGGTNSTGGKMYDVAVYHSGRVKLAKPAAYLSQSSGGVTVTDHCGLGVLVERR